MSQLVQVPGRDAYPAAQSLSCLRAGPLTFPKAGDRSNAYRLAVSVKTPTATLPVTADMILFNKGRTDVAVIFLGIGKPLPATLEQQAVSLILSRVR